ncbi:hypothetical protein HNP86_001895 [Methanococcus maripaludis]|uniref:Uncharacterized protein n=1 Tax=Methanococcus maripaludis TaxID=39152 RepID=A0A7J9P133_METMI|nr:hypothetical protein [Methanococcus maripaludis]MBA2851736.1 hypothetical protein [Methanococcus maripaludis]
MINNEIYILDATTDRTGITVIEDNLTYNALLKYFINSEQFLTELLTVTCVNSDFVITDTENPDLIDVTSDVNELLLRMNLVETDWYVYSNSMTFREGDVVSVLKALVHCTYLYYIYGYMTTLDENKTYMICKM